MRRFAPGESVALREIWHGRVGAARAVTVVLDDPGLAMLYIPAGSHWYGPDVDRPWVRLKAPGATWTLVERTWSDTNVLSFAWPGSGAAVLHFWDRGWEPTSWYVNVESPLRRFELGFDTFDQDLDVVVEPDRSSWRWKDEEDVAEGIRVGAYSEEDATAFRREAQRGLRRLLDREPPLDREWTGWRPDPSWPEPTLPDGWDRVGR